LNNKQKISSFEKLSDKGKLRLSGSKVFKQKKRKTIILLYIDFSSQVTC